MNNEIVIMFIFTIAYSLGFFMSKTFETTPTN